MGRLLREAEQRALSLLTERRDALDRLIDVLLERETIDGADVDALRSPPFGSMAPPQVVASG